MAPRNKNKISFNFDKKFLKEVNKKMIRPSSQFPINSTQINEKPPDQDQINFITTQKGKHVNKKRIEMIEHFEEPDYSEEANKDLLKGNLLTEKNLQNNSGISNNLTINIERKSNNSYKNEKNQYKRLLEDSQIKIESYKRIIASKDEEIFEMKRNIDDLKRKNNQFQHEMDDMKKNFNSLMMNYNKISGKMINNTKNVSNFNTYNNFNNLSSNQYSKTTTDFKNNEARTSSNNLFKTNIDQHKKTQSSITALYHLKYNR